MQKIRGPEIKSKHIRHMNKWARRPQLGKIYFYIQHGSRPNVGALKTLPASLATKTQTWNLEQLKKPGHKWKSHQSYSTAEFTYGPSIVVKCAIVQQCLQFWQDQAACLQTHTWLPALKGFPYRFSWLELPDCPALQDEKTQVPCY